MKLEQLLNYLWITGTVSVLMVQPVRAEVVQVTGVQLVRTDNGIEVILEIPDGKTPQVFRTRYGQTFVADIINTQLALPGGNSFRQDNPTVGITSVIVTQRDANSIQVRVIGKVAVPSGQVITSDRGLVLSLTPAVDTTTSQPTPETPDETTQKPDEANPEPDGTTQPSASGEEPIDVIVTATRTEEDPNDVPRSVTVIPREQIQQQTNLSRDLGEVLGKVVPGLAPPTQSLSTFGQSLRGRNTLVLIDGVPQSTSRNVFRDLRTIDPSAVERVEVLRGPTAIYGDGATGGVINIITRTPSEEKLTSTTELGLNSSLTNSEDSFGNNIQHLISGKEGNFDFTVSGSFTNTGSFFDARGDLIPPDPNGQGGIADAETINLLGKFGVEFDDEQRLQLTFNRFDTGQDTDYTTDPEVNRLAGRQKARTRSGLSLEDPQGTENTVLNLDYTHENIFGSRLQGQVYYRDLFTRFFPFDARTFRISDSPLQSRVESEKVGGRLQLETPLFNQGAASLLWGVDYFNEETSQPVAVFDPAIYDSSRGLVFRQTEDRVWTPPLEQSSLGLFAQLNWDISEQVNVRGGIRHESADVNVDDFTTLAGNNIGGGELDFNATLFNVGAVFHATEQVNLFANFSQGFSLADIGLSLRNARAGFSVESLSPEPQKVDNYEVGVRGDWKSVQASLVGFYNESDLGTTFTAPGTVIRAPEQVYGIEATLDVQPSNDWQLGGSVSFVEGDIDTGDDGEYDPLDGFRIPPLILRAYVENETLPGWRNRLQALFSGSRDRFDDSTVFGRRAVESYFTLDYISSINIGSGTLQLGIENLFNDQYFPVVSQLQSEDTAYSAARGRTLSIRYSINW